MKPKAVRDAEENANKILADINKPPDPNSPVPPVDPPVVSAPDPVAPAEPIVDPIPPVVPEPSAPPVDYEQKYKTLQGKYDNELPKLYGEVGDFKVKLAEALTIISELKKTPTTPAPVDTPPPGIGYMRKEMPEMEDAVRYIVKEEATKLVKDLVGNKVGEVDTKLNNLEAATVKNAGNIFYDNLAAKVPTWAVINENADFLKWLEDIEPYTGYKKMDLLQDAVAKLDVIRTAKFFTDFITESKAVPKPPAAPGKFEAPPKPVGGGNPPIPSDEGYVTSGEITKFYNDVAVGKYKNREVDRVAMESKINKALAEGKIR